MALDRKTKRKLRRYYLDWDILLKPIKNLKDARAYIRHLADSGNSYHLDDDAFTVHHLPSDKFCESIRSFTDIEASALNRRVSEIHSIKDWGRFGCPHGYHSYYLKLKKMV